MHHRPNPGFFAKAYVILAAVQAGQNGYTALTILAVVAVLNAVVPVALLLAAALLGPDTAVAAEPTSGYSQTAPTPKTTPSTPAKTTPTTGTSPSKEEKTTPSKETAPSTSTSTTPTSTTSASKEKASTLPFTGFDLRWALGVGVLLLATGFSIVLVERRQRRRAGR